MIGIFIKNKLLDIGDVTITLKYENTIFSNNLFVKGFSYNFSIPKTHNNISILDNISSLNNIKSKFKFESKITFDGLLLMEAILIVKEINHNSILVNFISNELNLFKDLSNLKLTDLELDKFSVYEESDVATIKQVKWGDHLQNYISKLLGNKKIKTHHFPPIRTNDIYKGKNANFIGIVNYYDWNNPSIGGYYPTVYLQNYNPLIEPDFKYTISPCPLLIYVIEKILNKKGFYLKKNDFVLSEIIQNIIIYSANVMDNLVVENLKRLNIYEKEYKLEDYLPDVSQYDIFEVFFKLFKCIFSINNKEVTLTPFKDIENLKIEDLTQYCAPEYSKKILTKSSTKFIYSTLTSEKYYKENITDFEEVIIGDTIEKITEINSEILRPLSNTEEDYNILNSTYNNLQQLALDEIIGKSTFVSKNEKLKKILLGVYRGYYDGYPLFTNVNKVNTPIIGNNITVGKETLFWKGENGIINNHWLDYINYNNGSNTITKKLYIPLHKFKELATFKNPIKSFYHENGSVDGILQSIEITLSNKGISPTKTTFYLKK